MSGLCRSSIKEEKIAVAEGIMILAGHDALCKFVYKRCMDNMISGTKNMTLESIESKKIIMEAGNERYVDVFGQDGISLMVRGK